MKKKIIEKNIMYTCLLKACVKEERKTFWVKYTFSP